MAAALTQEANDKKQLVPMLEQVEQNMGRKPEQATADTGYFSEAAVTDPKVEGIELLVPPERQKRGGPSAPVQIKPDADLQATAQPTGEDKAQAQMPAPSVAETMREKLKTTAGHAVY